MAELKDQRKTLSIVQFGHSLSLHPRCLLRELEKRVGLRSGRGGTFYQSLAAEDVLSCVAMDVVTAALIIGLLTPSSSHSYPFSLNNVSVNMV